MTDAVNHPKHYGGAENPFEAIKVIEAWELGFCLGNTVKYISRAGKKAPGKLEDLRKAAWYLNREIQKQEAELGKVEPTSGESAGKLAFKEPGTLSSLGAGVVSQEPAKDEAHQVPRQESVGKE